MINSAINSLIVQSGVSVNGIFPSVGEQGVDFPYVVYNSKGTPENSKDGFDIKHYTVQVDVYAAMEKTKNFIRKQRISSADFGLVPQNVFKDFRKS